MREKLIDIIECYADFLDWDRKEDMVDSIMEKCFATDNNVGGWIPVTERLPEKDVKVLTYGVYGFSVNYRDRFSGKWRGVNGKPQWITHWMPLPEPPKGE